MEVFETMLANYYGAINGKPNAAAQKAKSRVSGKKILKEQLTDSSTKQSKSGAAFLAVCRGKVSEGIDFSDKNARVVIVVGIPFPNQKDMQVSMKKQYNTQNKVSKNLLSGDQWYCYQAFRALNQAVGRCIRHRHDYGAIILLDERYKRASNLEYMSKWLRSSIQQVESLEDSLEGLQLFFKKFKDTLPQSVDANKNSTKDDVKKKLGSSNQTLHYCAVTAPAKQSKKITPFDDKENINKGMLRQAAATAPAKQRFLKHEQSTMMSCNSVKPFAPRCNDRTQKGTKEVQSVGAECNQSSTSRQCRSPLQEILPQARENLDSEPAESGPMITLTESPTVAARCSSLGCFRDGAHEDTSARRCGSGIEEQWTPIASTISNSSEVNASILLNTTSNSHDTSVSAWNHVTPCNLFGNNIEDIPAPVARTHEMVPTIDPLVRSLTTDFMVCKKLSLGNGNSCVADYSLSASKRPSIQVEVPTEKQDTSILCLKCRGSLLRALQHGNLQKVTLKKKFLSRLLDLMNPCRECQPAEHTDVLICEMQLLHPLVEASTSNANNLNQSVWVEEDGCVFKPLYCPWCNYNHCIGAYVSAANRMNMNLVDMALIFCDALLTTEREEKCIQGAQYRETEATEERLYTQSLNSFAKRTSQTQTPPRPKLKLPRRD